MFSFTSRAARLALAGAAALAVTVGAAGSVLAAGGASPNGSAGGGSASTTLVATLAPVAGSQVQFVTVAPCRIIDTRNVGGPINGTTRTFTADGPYAGQGGNVAGCNVPSNLVAVQLNLGAISAAGQKGWVKAWAAGTTEPLASLVNFPTNAPIANMVTIPVNGSGNFTVRTFHSAHIFADVAGYYVKPLYAQISSTGSVYSGVSSGVVSTTHPGTGEYTVTFDRDVSKCAATGSDIVFAGTRDISIDTHFSADPRTVTVRVTNASNTLENTFFNLSLAC